MEVKGVAVISMKQYVSDKFGSRYDEWMSALSAPARDIVRSVLAGDWYPLQAAIIEPTQLLCKMFHGGQERGAWELGRFSADYALRGPYSIYVKLASAGFILSRGSRIMAQYYNPCELKVIENKPTRGVVQIVKFDEPSSLVEMRIGGWIERALEIGLKKLKTAEITKSLAKGDAMTEFVFEWE